MRQAVQRAWRGRGWLARLLWPLSLLYGTVTFLRRAAYRAGVLRSERLPVPVVVVGNVVAGGAGKTPLVLALLAHLERTGWRAGVVSRGYGRSTQGSRAVEPASDPGEVGDEPLLLRRRSGRPVQVAPRRAEGARDLLRAHPDTQVIVCDDGLQHLALARDVEVCVFDARGAGNGWLLPAGPLREPWPRKVDLVVCHGEPAGIGGFRMQRRLADHAVRADGARRPLAELAGSDVTAVAGTAQPDVFFTMLNARGLRLARVIPLPDHHDFASPLPGIRGMLLCTEKDAAKLWRHHPEAWAVPLEVEIEPAFWDSFDRLLTSRLSSKDGPPPS
jgi:tetraacyldisaccharide 4'-kinase